MVARVTLTKSPAFIFPFVLHFTRVAFLAVESSRATILVPLKHGISHHVPSLLLLVQFLPRQSGASQTTFRLLT